MNDWRFGKNRNKIYIINGILGLLLLIVICVIGNFALKGIGKAKDTLEKKTMQELQETKEEALNSLDTAKADAGPFTDEQISQIQEQYDIIKTQIQEAEKKDNVQEIIDDFYSYIEELSYSSEQQPAAESEKETAESATITASLVDRASASVDSYAKVSVIQADATSVISQEGVDNSPMKLFDGLDDTNWEEGVDGYGIGESLWFDFDREYKVKYITLRLGNWKSDKYYYGNAKPKTMTIEMGDFSTQITFSGEKKEECVELSQPWPSTYMKLTIDEVYTGTSWEDTCINELEIYGE